MGSVKLYATIMLMIIVILLVLGLSLGSFVNALVWRIHEQEHEQHTKKRAKHARDLSIIDGRSMCPNCHHELAGKDLIPVFSWLWLKGKCRYCHKPISWQYPVVEALTALLFSVSYMYWPNSLVSNIDWALFALWLLLLTGLIALAVYDLHWYLLPDRIMLPSAVVALVSAAITVSQSDKPLHTALYMLCAVAVGGGIFYVLFQASKGTWIGGGDVKLGWLLGLVVATPARAFMMIFVASLAGTLAAGILLATKRLKKSQVVPFGPFLIFGTYIVVLWGQQIADWYQRVFII